MEQTEYQEQLRELTQWILKGRCIIFFGGASASTENGIPDFHSADGLYAEKRRYPSEQVVSHGFFLAHTEQFYDFYKGGMLYLDAKPNAVHPALAAPGRQGKPSAVVTQNIGRLCEKVGSKRVLPLHGTVLKNHCLRCGKFYFLAELLSRPGTVPHYDYGGTIKPDVMPCEEALGSAPLIEVARRIAEAGLLVVGGTSLAVYPAMRPLRYFGGRHLVIINRNATLADRDVDLVTQASIREVLSKALEETRWSVIFTVSALVKRPKIR